MQASVERYSGDPAVSLSVPPERPDGHADDGEREERNDPQHDRGGRNAAIAGCHDDRPHVESERQDCCHDQQNVHYP